MKRIVFSQGSRGALPFALGIAFLGAYLVFPSRADRTTGTWTGAVEVRGNYFWERSTRVLAPEAGVSLVSPDGLRLDAHYLVDNITSASIATGVVSDVRFTEIRHDVSLGAGYEIDMGGEQLDLSTRLRYSNEPDYKSYGATLGGTLSIAERSTTLTLQASYLHDDVSRIVRMFDPDAGVLRALPMNCAPDGSSNVGCNLNVFYANASFTRVLSPQIFVEAGYDLYFLDGIQSNVYRMVMVEGMPRREQHPGQRNRHALYGRLAIHAPKTDTGFHLMLRGYADSWNVLAITPELRVYQNVADLFTLRLRYRFTAQTHAFFQSAPTGYSNESVYVTADPKLQESQSHEWGVQVLLPLSFFEGSAFDFARDATWDLSVDFRYATPRDGQFGTGIVAMSGLRVPY